MSDEEADRLFKRMRYELSAVGWLLVFVLVPVGVLLLWSS